MLRLVPLLWSLLATKIHARFESERGATAVEYGLMVAAIAAVIIVAVITVGENVNDAFEFVNTEWEGIGGD